MKTKTEESFIRLRYWSSHMVRKFIPISIRHKFLSLGRFIPQASEYSIHDSYLLKRDNTIFKINRSDYVHWRLFYGVRDLALKEAKKHVKPGSIVLDIGASFGAFSLRLACYMIENKYQDVQIHAFEPNPLVFSCYRENLSLNEGFDKIINLYPTGLGDKNERRSFQYDASNTGAGRVVDQSAGKIDVSLQRLDDFLIPLNPKNVAFIKLIVEGFEPQALAGGWESIKKYRPPIFLEVTPTWWAENNSGVEETLDKLRALGYSFMIEHYNELRPYEPVKYDSRFQFNLLARVKN